MDVSDEAQLLLDNVLSWMLKDASDWSFAGLPLMDQNGVWQLHLG